MIQTEKSWGTDRKSPNVTMYMLDSQIHKIIFVFQVLLLIKSFVLAHKSVLFKLHFFFNLLDNHLLTYLGNFASIVFCVVTTEIQWELIPGGFDQFLFGNVPV